MSEPPRQPRDPRQPDQGGYRPPGQPYRRPTDPRDYRQPGDPYQQADHYQPDPYQSGGGQAPDPYRRAEPYRADESYRQAESYRPERQYPPTAQYRTPEPYRQESHRPAESYRPTEPYRSGDSYRPEPHRPTAPTRPPQSFPSESGGGGFRLPGLGVILAIVGAAVQLLSLVALPWFANGGDAQSLISIWHTLSDSGASGFGAWYLLVFSYPLAILGVLLAFAAVLESVAMKVVWGGLVVLGVGYLLLRYGVAPLTGLFGVERDFTTRDVVLAVAAVAAAVVAVFVLKSAVTMFRRVAGLVLLALSGLHVAALNDLTDGGLSSLSIGAFGPVAGYLIIAVAALVGPRRFVPGT
ncbi:hypothetical protein [Actinokineospora sp. NBRC 105648]|uniref:hypothetical protein n=1 Tax=Actinokineospora sp. NBRC 105648 TaxID=3032206 RepID=UPI0024A2FD33|nr:hypothetical protein [Actinokineospora sp. NBRC 105648]GLZ39749.1 hypothetical protein Acsp05_33730 [Actinokineospora sp. NBRC 105648]